MGTGRKPLTIMLVIIIFQLPTDVFSDEPTWSCYEQTGSCYYFPDFYSHQLEASCLCRSLGGHLIKLDSTTKLNLVGQLMQNENRLEGFWLGVTNKKNESRYLWEDGTNAEDIMPWYDGEPTTPELEHCVILVDKIWLLTPPISLGDFLALDVDCDAWNMYAACERDMKSARVWSARSRDEIYPSARMESYSGIRSLECADSCARNCRCFSMAYRQNGGHCILYTEHFRFLTSPEDAPGYVNFD